MSGLMERLAQYARRGTPRAAQRSGMRPARAGMPSPPDPREIARLRRKLEQAMRDHRGDVARKTMREVVAVLGRSLPLALPPPSHFPGPQRQGASQTAFVETATQSPSPREATVVPAHPLRESLMERLRQTAGTPREQASSSALPSTEFAGQPVVKRTWRA